MRSEHSKQLREVERKLEIEQQHLVRTFIFVCEFECLPQHWLLFFTWPSDALGRTVRLSFHPVYSLWNVFMTLAIIIVLHVAFVCLCLCLISFDLLVCAWWYDCFLSCPISKFLMSVLDRVSAHDSFAFSRLGRYQGRKGVDVDYATRVSESGIFVCFSVFFYLQFPDDPHPANGHSFYICALYLA